VIEHPSAWTSRDIGSRDRIAVVLQRRHVDALEKALARWAQRGEPLEAMTRADFDLTSIVGDIAAWLAEIQDGRGILFLDGFPIAGHANDRIAAMFYGLGLHLGRPLSQSVLGDRLGHVIDMSREKPDARSYQNREAMKLHTDFCDILGMLSIRTAADGGASRYVSAVAVHNAIATTRPELLEPLYRGFPFHLMGEEMHPGEAATSFDVPIFSVVDGFLSCIFSYGLAVKGMAAKGRKLSNLQAAALEYLVETCHRPDLMLEFTIAPGQIVFANNLIALHGRTEVANTSQGPRRHLLRLWLAAERARPRVDAIDLYQCGGGIPRSDARRPGYADDGALARAIAGAT
jgi:hypothetical protein